MGIMLVGLARYCEFNNTMIEMPNGIDSVRILMPNGIISVDGVDNAWICKPNGINQLRCGTR